MLQVMNGYLASEKRVFMSSLDLVSQQSEFLTDEQRWNAVLQRDQAADGRFYYSVSTTGVYCRPSCGARRAQRKNVRFHENCGDAQKAGFRPCKRCRPDEAPLAERQKAAIAKACNLLQKDEKLDPIKLAAIVGMSRFHFHRIFKQYTGLTPKQYATAHRINRVRHELATSATVTEAIYGAGFNSSGRFTLTRQKCWE